MTRDAAFLVGIVYFESRFQPAIPFSLVPLSMIVG